MTGPLSQAQALDQFMATMSDAGIRTDDRIIPDGALHRFKVEGDKHGAANGWYVLHMDGLPAGVFGSWKGMAGTWRADIGRTLTRTEQAAHRTRMEAARALRDAEQARVRQCCRDRAERVWRNAGEAGAAHAYLTSKGIGAHGTRQHAGCVIVPVLDVAGDLHGVQFIAPDGGKRFLTGTAKAAHFYPIGSLANSAGATLAIAEGFATAATVHEATGWPTVAAFDAGNLEPVALALAKAYPDRRIVIAADNDRHTPGNPGLTTGRRAASAVGGMMIFPNFRDGDDGTDWNDYAARYGRIATTTALQKAAREVSHDR